MSRIKTQHCRSVHLQDGKSMKRIRIYLLSFCAAVFALTCLTACGSFSNMSEQDAYDIGYGAGRALRYMIDN